MTDEQELRCPSCGSNRVTVAEETMFMVNTMEHWCHSVKAHDADAKADCLACRWQGIRAQLTAAQAKGADPEDLAAAGVMLMGRRADHA